MRLFFAVHFDAPVTQMLLDAVAQMRAQGVSANFTRPENLHLTLAYIGETKNVSAAKEALDATGAPPFLMTVGGFGRFGDLYWIGIDENPALKKLALGLQERLRAEGFAIERRAWKPHITLARRVVSEALLGLHVPKIEMPVGKVSLMRSDRVAGILRYTAIHEKELEI